MLVRPAFLARRSESTVKIIMLIQVSTKDKSRTDDMGSWYTIVAVMNIRIGEVYWIRPTVVKALLFTPHANNMSGTDVATPVPINRSVVHVPYGK